MSTAILKIRQYCAKAGRVGPATESHCLGPGYGVPLLFATRPFRPGPVDPDPTNSYFQFLISRKMQVAYNEKECLICITPPPLPEGSRTPIDLVAVVDCSGSMGSAVVRSGAEMSDGFTILNLVNHAVRTTIASLEPATDRFGLVSFDSKAVNEFVLAPLHAANLARATSVTNQLEPRGNTNIWAGVEAALIMLEYSRGISSASSKNTLPVILLQTDGAADLVPSVGTLQALRNWRTNHPLRQQPLIFTTGFGVNSESKELAALAETGDGLYAYIHDAGGVGTVFVHALSNIFQLVGTRLELVINGINYPCYTVGPLLAGQRKFIKVAPTVFAAGQNGITSVALTYEAVGGGERLTVPATADLLTTVDPATILREHCRVDLVSSFKAALRQVDPLRDVEAADRTLNDLTKRLDTVIQLQQQQLGAVAGTPEASASIEALLSDTGEARKAIQNFLNGSWGGPHLRSILAAHEKQVCLDFKNPGLQYYTSPARQVTVQALDMIFNTLPPPQPGFALHGRGSSSGSSSGISYVAPPVSMAAYNRADDPCVHGKSLTLLRDGTELRADHLRKGHVLANGATIVCVIKTLTQDGYADLVQIPGSGLCITPYHPVRYVATNSPDKALGTTFSVPWQFPIDWPGAKMERLPCPALYSFVLSSTHIIDFDGVDTVTLGHGLQDNAVVQHPYLGSRYQVVQDLTAFPGYEAAGLVQFASGCLKRDPQTGLVNGFNPAFLL